MNILVIEDDATVAEVVQLGLERARYEVDVAHDGAAGLDMAGAMDYALVILDLMLPGMDGRTVCSRLRERHNPVPILMLTARDSVSDRIEGLESGADDYLGKPFEFPELLARVRALLRRETINKGRIVRIHDLEIDTKRRRVVRAGRQIALTPREYDLLETLARNAGRTLTRDLLQDTVWSGEIVYPNTVDAHIKGLRRKVDADSDVRLIQTVYGLGYMLKHPENGPDT